MDANGKATLYLWDDTSFNPRARDGRENQKTDSLGTITFQSTRP